MDHAHLDITIKNNQVTDAAADDDPFNTTLNESPQLLKININRHWNNKRQENKTSRYQRNVWLHHENRDIKRR